MQRPRRWRRRLPSRAPPVTPTLARPTRPISRRPKTGSTNATSPLKGSFSNVTVTDSGTRMPTDTTLYDVSADLHLHDPSINPATLDRTRAMWAAHSRCEPRHWRHLPGCGQPDMATDCQRVYPHRPGALLLQRRHQRRHHRRRHLLLLRQGSGRGAPTAGHVQMYNEVSNGGVKFGDLDLHRRRRLSPPARSATARPT